MMLGASISINLSAQSQVDHSFYSPKLHKIFSVICQSKMYQLDIIYHSIPLEINTSTQFTLLMSVLSFVEVFKDPCSFVKIFDLLFNLASNLLTPLTKIIHFTIELLKFR